VKRIEAQHAERTSFSGESVMDYWLGKDRLKGSVLVMGTSGKKVRFNALSPAGDDVLADMACDGEAFAYVNKQNNCQVTGPCDRNAVATFLGAQVEPEDFLWFAVGSVPLAAQDGKVTWDPKNGHEQVTLTGPAGTQSLEVDLRGGRLDVIKSALVDPAGKTVWSIENGDFANVKTDAGAELRAPNKTRFKSPQNSADLVVEWKDRKFNPDLSAPDKFKVNVPEGLARCGGK
jgi:hypothetical protein